MRENNHVMPGSRRDIAFLAAIALAAGAAVFLPSLRAVFPDAAVNHPVPALLCLAAGVAAALWNKLAGLRSRASGLVFDSGAARFNFALAAAAAAVYAAAGLWFLDGLPYLDDDAAALWQARVFASGRLLLPLPEHAEFFDMFGMLGARAWLGHWMSMYPPGLPLALVPGVWLGAPWLVNPLLGGGLCAMTAITGEELFARRAGRIAGLMAMFSPFVSGLSSTHLSHTPAAFFLVLCLWATVRLTRSGGRWYGAVAGAAWAMAFLCRPLTALAVGAAIALFPLVNIRGALKAWRAVALALMLAASGCAGLAAWQKVSTGDASVPGHLIGMGRRGKWGFERLDWARRHTPAAAVGHTLDRARAVNGKLLGWPLPALLLVFWPLLSGRGGWKEAWLVLPWFALLCWYAFYWYFESCYPGRYTFSAAPMLIVAAARGYVSLEAGLARARRFWPALPPALLAGGLLFSAAVGMPGNYSLFVPPRGDLERVLPDVLARHGVRNAVVFMRAQGRGKAESGPMNDYYASGFIRNSLGLDGDIVYARDLADQNARLAAAYPGRRYCLYTYHRDSDTGDLREIEFENNRLESGPPDQ